MNGEQSMGNGGAQRIAGAYYRWELSVISDELLLDKLPVPWGGAGYGESAAHILETLSERVGAETISTDALTLATTVGGHDAKVVFLAGEKLVVDLPKYIQAVEDAGGDTKQIVPLVQNVITAALAFANPAIAIGAALGSAGTNLTADEAAISSVMSDAGTLDSALSTFVAAVKALATAIGADWEQLSADLEAAA